MSRLVTVDDAVAETRSLIDESNTSTVDDITDILPSLNRAQIKAFDILTKHYPEPLLVPTDNIALTSGVSEFDIPENVFEDRIMKVEFNNSGFYYEAKRISYRDITYFETPTVVPIPSYYCIYGRKVKLVPAPDGAYTMRIWTIREPDQLVLSQGRITATSVAGNYVVVEGLGDDLTPENDNLNSFVNIVDGQTGEVKQSLQIASIVGSRITFRATPQRPTVINRTIESAVSSDVTEDDYVCVVKGVCVPFYAYPLYNFMVQYAANEMNRKLKNESMADLELLKGFEDQVKRTWSGREMTLRVKKRSKHWMPRRARRSYNR